MNQKEMLARVREGEDPLELSIKKWEDVIKKGSKAEDGWRNCALCYIYYSSDECLDSCKDCPVFEKTKRKYCNGTPYEEYNKARVGLAELKRLKKIAKEEVAFLKSLRKK